MQKKLFLEILKIFFSALYKLKHNTILGGVKNAFLTPPPPPEGLHNFANLQRNYWILFQNIPSFVFLTKKDKKYFFNNFFYLFNCHKNFFYIKTKNDKIICFQSWSIFFKNFNLWDFEYVLYSL